MSRRYQDREAVYVTPSAEALGLLYGFNTNLTDGDRSALGQQPISAATDIIVFGAQRPKPPRFRETTSGVSSFGDVSIAASPPDGWALTKGGRSLPRPSTTEKTQLVYISLNSLKYAWRLPIETREKIGGDLSALGIQAVTGSDKCVIGVNSIRNLIVDGIPITKPPRAAKVVSGTDGIDRISTFYAPGSELPDGWVPID